MPALYTHYKFGQDVLNKVRKNLRKSINGNICCYNIWNQGWDNLYYHINWRYYKKVGSKAHKENISEFFSNLITFIIDNELENCFEVTNMLYGFINHYTLDTIVHPYINYQVKNLNIPHTKIEYIIDNILYEDTYFEKMNSNFFKTIIPKVNFDNNTKNILNYTFEKTHNEKNIANAINFSHNNSYYLYRYFIYDKFGLKTYIYKLIDYITPFKKTKIHKSTYKINDTDNRLLNLNNINWTHPKNKKEVHTYSIYELYKYSLKIAVKINNLAFKVINNNASINELINLIELIDIKNIQVLLKK